MVAAPLADVSDVAAIWRPLTDTETGQIGTLIEKASAKLRHKAPFDVDARMAVYAVTPGDPMALDPAVVADVVANIVKRFLVNADGVVSSTETVGAVSRSVVWVNRYDKAGSDVRGLLEVTPQDIEQLRPAVPALAPRSLQLAASDAMRLPEWYVRDFGARPYRYGFGPYPYPYPSNAGDVDDAYFNETQ